MSIGVVCNLADGVVLGVDSAATIHGEHRSPTGEVTRGVLNVYEESEKLFELKGRPAAVMVTGLATFAERTLESYVREFETTKLSRLSEEEAGDLDKVVDCLRDFFRDIYSKVIQPAVERETGQPFQKLPRERKPVADFVVAGFSQGQYLSEVWHFRLPILPDEPEKPQRVRDRGSFGTNWYGHTGAIHRLIKGYDPQLIEELMSNLVQDFGLKESKKLREGVQGLLQRHETPMPYQGMPLGVGIRHVKFLLDVVIGHTDFAVGGPICGGRTRIAAVTRDGVRWIAEHQPTVAPQTSARGLVAE